MRQSTATAIGIAVYVALVGGVIGGAYAAFEAVIGAVPAQTASLEAPVPAHQSHGAVALYVKKGASAEFEAIVIRRN